MFFLQNEEMETNALGIPYFRDDPESHDYENLRQNPDAIKLIPEVRKAAALYDFVKELNSPKSVFQTFGCEKWIAPFSIPQIPAEYCLRSGSYVDIAYADLNLCRTNESLLRLIEQYKTYGPSKITNNLVNVGFEIRPTVSSDWGNWWTLEFWNYGIGRNETEAEQYWVDGMRCFQQFLLEQSC